MATSAFDLKHRPRELRRRVVLPARVRIGVRWTDACILNVSSRGLMIRTGYGISEGSLVEIRRGDQSIFARVMWREGPRAGLQSDDQLPVEDIMTLAQTGALQVTAAESLIMDRRWQKRPVYEDSRLRARTMQFIASLVIAAALSVAVFSMLQQALAKPLALIDAALGS